MKQKGMLSRVELQTELVITVLMRKVKNDWVKKCKIINYEAGRNM